VSEADAAAYGISAVYQLDNGSYRVEGSQKGFQSDVQAAVTLDAEGNVSAVEILSQAETDSLGGQCVDPEFTSQYQGAAPFTLTGKSYTVTDPASGKTWSLGDKMMITIVRADVNLGKIDFEVAPAAKA
jgi:hypothetical protein